MLQGDKVPSYSLAIVLSEQLNKVLTKTTQLVMMQCFSLQVNFYSLEARENELSMTANTMLELLQGCWLVLKMFLRNRGEFLLSGCKTTRFV